jgi:superfamily II DNA or RNA helicase
MKLRPRQVEFVQRVNFALAEHGNTLGIAPTGAGKTVMLSATVDFAQKRKPGLRSLVIQHRDELVAQNRSTFRRVAPDTSTDVFAADRKRWSDGVTFAMVQTLAREDNLATMPAMDLIVIDEAHHVAADSYIRIIDRALELNPKVNIFGVTATPQRADKKALKKVFSNVADVISIKELIDSGNLVRPRVFVIDCGLRAELAGVRRTVADFDMAEVEKVMDKQAVTDKVITEWKAKAGTRKTVVFCSTVEHARHVCQAFADAKVQADIIHGTMSDGSRRSTLMAFEKDKFQVLVNVAVLTEGWDCQTVSCVVLLRPCSFKSTMIQMIGRGLRKVDPDKFPGVVKSDCIVLDFGYSILTHGGLDTEVVLEPHIGKTMTKCCPQCNIEVPMSSKICPACDYVFDTVERRRSEAEERGILEDFSLTEVEILELSPFRWEAMWGGAVTIANAMTAWACVVQHNGRQYAIGGHDNDAHAKLIAISDDRLLAIASADDYLREYGDRDAARKSKRWLHEPPSDKQLAALGYTGFMIGLTKYRAVCELTWKWKEKQIKAKVLAI